MNGPAACSSGRGGGGGGGGGGVDVLGWLNFISQGVVANSWGAGPTMTVLHSYYPQIVFSHTRTLNIFLMLIHHSGLFYS